MSGDEFDRKVEEWHEGNSPLPLHEYLGMTWDAYVAWVDAKPLANPSNEGGARG